jgi:hypothetical protein
MQALRWQNVAVAGLMTAGLLVPVSTPHAGDGPTMVIDLAAADDVVPGDGLTPPPPSDGTVPTPSTIPTPDTLPTPDTIPPPDTAPPPLGDVP